MQKYVAFLRGINVSGHHKLPMADLKAELGKLGFKNVITLLNSGNVIFESETNDNDLLENKISDHLTNRFDFPIPVIIRKAEMISDLISHNPFKDIVITEDIRLYVSFLRQGVTNTLGLPWSTDDNSYQILSFIDQTVVSVLDLSITKTTKGMEALEKLFGKDITTRNFNTIKRIAQKLQ